MTDAVVALPPKLVSVFEGVADIRGAYGGRGSGKTRTFAKMTAVRGYMWDQAGERGIILCGRQFMNSLADSSMEEVKEAIRSEPWLHAAYDIGERYVRTKSGRIQYAFTGLDRNIDSVKSKSHIKLGWIDEAEPVTDEAWVKLIPTLREEDSELWVTWNPESKRSPTHRRFREGMKEARIKIEEINWRDNPWFPLKLERDRQRDMRDRPDQYNHIWEGDFAEVFEGAYYVRELIAARESGRICNVPVHPDLPVHTAWDLGIGDSTAIFMYQVLANEVRIIDFYENHGHGLPHYVEVLDAKAYHYGIDWVPHDAKVRELGTGRTRVETLVELGRNPEVVPAHTLMDGIAAARKTIPSCWFDAKRTEEGLDALRQYRSQFKEDTAVFSDKPLHDWSSHAADAFRYLALAWQEQRAEIEPRPKPRDETALEIDDQGRLVNNVNIMEWAQKRRRQRIIGMR